MTRWARAVSTSLIVLLGGFAVVIPTEINAPKPDTALVAFRCENACYPFADMPKRVGGVLTCFCAHPDSVVGEPTWVPLPLPPLSEEDVQVP